MEKINIFIGSFMVIGLVLYMSIMAWDVFTGEKRVIEECKQDCNDLNLDYFKGKRGAWNQDNCICINQQ